MSNEVAVASTNGKRDFAAIERVLVTGDLSKLSAEDRVVYVNRVCETLGLNPLTQPFAYITLNGKMVLYALKSATEQLRNVHKISIVVKAREQIGDVYVVTAQARSSVREDESTGAVSTAGLKGEALANAFMKAETKAKRRVTLSICGLGLLDETEVDDIPASAKGGVYPEQPGPEDGVQTDEYCCSGNLAKAFPALARKQISRCDPAILRDAIGGIESKSNKTGKPIPPWAVEFIMHAEPIVSAWENAQPQNPEALDLEPGSEG